MTPKTSLTHSSPRLELERQDLSVYLRHMHAIGKGKICAPAPARGQGKSTPGDLIEIVRKLREEAAEAANRDAELATWAADKASKAPCAHAAPCALATRRTVQPASSNRTRLGR